MTNASIGNDMTVRVLHYALDGLTLQQNAIANNISNDQTPNYTATEVDFQSSLQAALKTPSPGTIASTSIYASPNAPGTDGNNVNLAEELVAASKATLQYQAVVTAMNFKFNLLANPMQQPAVTV